MDDQERGGSPTSTLSGPEGVQDFLVCSYNNAAVLAHTPSGTPCGEGVYGVNLDLATGALRPSGVTAQLSPNPAFICPHPTLPHVLYVSTERIDANGEVVQFFRDAEGTLTVGSTRDAVFVSCPCTRTPLTRQPRALSQGGRSTCFLFVHPSHRYLVAVSYWDAVTTVLNIFPDGSLGETVYRRQEPAAAQFFHAQGQPTREVHWRYRQKWPHAHCVVQEPYSRSLLFTTDLGLDCCHVWRLDVATGRMDLAQTVNLDPGRGPRHLCFHPRVRAAFVVNELDSTVSVLRYHGEEVDDQSVSASTDAVEDACPAAVVSSHSKNAVLQHLQTLSSLPECAQGKSVTTPCGIWKAASHSSELRLRPDGRFLYVGNRGHDSIAVFKVDENQGGLLTLDHVVPAGGACPRNFNFTKCGSFLVVGCQNTSTLVSFACDPSTGMLTPKASMELPSPNYVHAL